MWGQLYSSNRETVLGTPILNVRPVTLGFTPTADHCCWSCSMLCSDVRSDVVLCETPRLKNIGTSRQSNNSVKNSFIGKTMAFYFGE